MNKERYFTIQNGVNHIATLRACDSREIHYKVLIALEEYYDIQPTVIGEFDIQNIVNCKPFKFKASIDGNLSEFTIQETWLY